VPAAASSLNRSPTCNLCQRFSKKAGRYTVKTRIRAESVRQIGNRQYSGNWCPLRASYLLYMCAGRRLVFARRRHSHLPRRQRVRHVVAHITTSTTSPGTEGDPLRKFHPKVSTYFFSEGAAYHTRELEDVLRFLQLPLKRDAPKLSHRETGQRPVPSAGVTLSPRP
jgi:hypothetical protein